MDVDGDECVFLLQDTVRVTASRQRLSAHSDVFSAMLGNGFREGQMATPVIPIRDTPGSAFTGLVHFFSGCHYDCCGELQRVLQGRWRSAWFGSGTISRLIDWLIVIKGYWLQEFSRLIAWFYIWFHQAYLANFKLFFCNLIDWESKIYFQFDKSPFLVFCFAAVPIYVVLFVI